MIVSCILACRELHAQAHYNEMTSLGADEYQANEREDTIAAFNVRELPRVYLGTFAQQRPVGLRNENDILQQGLAPCLTKRREEKRRVQSVVKELEPHLQD